MTVQRAWIRPEDKPRACHGCVGGSGVREYSDGSSDSCETCNGTGRLGRWVECDGCARCDAPILSTGYECHESFPGWVPAEGDIEVFQNTDGRWCFRDTRRTFTPDKPWEPWSAEYMTCGLTTPEAAIKAAREALREDGT